MAPVLWCLLLLLLLPYLLAVSGGLYKWRVLGRFDIHHPRVQDADLKGTANRIRSSQANAWEALPFFAGCVLVAHLRGVELDAMTTPALLFLATRLAHPVFYIGNLPVGRASMVALGVGTGIYLAVS